MNSNLLNNFPEIYQAEKRAEEIALQAEQERKIITARLNDAKQSGASDEDIKRNY